jgi:soluble lytic murein transglycosylase
MIAALTAFALGYSPVSANSGAAVGAAMDSVRQQDWAAAEAAAKPAGRTGQAIVEWHYLRAGKGSIAQYEGFLKRHADWPGLPYLRKAGERSLSEGASAARVLAYFSSDAPQTGRGALALAAAMVQTGDTVGAKALVVDAWREMSLTSAEQLAFLDRHDATIKPHHQARMDMLLWRGLSGEAQALMPYVSSGWQKLAAARIGLRKQVDGVDGLIAAIPVGLASDPGLAYERFVWRARKDRNVDALELLNERSKSAASLGQPENWARRRAALARREMRAGRYKSAYTASSRHQLSTGSHFADLEWLSGYVALRYLNKPSAALQHFKAFEAAVDTPISLGRAGYWQGRAYEAMGDNKRARAAYTFGGGFQTSFYGQLAAEKAGIAMDTALLGKEKFPSWKSASFEGSTVFEAGQLLEEAGESRLSARFISHLSESLGRDERGALAAWAIADRNPYVALHVAKRAVQYGDTLHAAYYPMHALAQKRGIGVSPELALAIARRESEFNPAVVSSAGARGLMQVMPGTAKLVSKKLGIEYSASKLNDWEYNARLGTSYLEGLNAEFGDNVILVSAGYNAGPGRPRRWLRDKGDPRASVERVVDWIEHIPFNETRNYTMRVSEALLPYRAQLSGKPQKLRLSKDLTQR